MRVEAPSSAADFDLLPMWYGLAGVDSGDDVGAAGDVANFRQAWEGGYLGAASGKGFKQNLAALTSLDQEQWRYARTAVRLLTYSGEQIGILSMGYHHQLWNFVGELTAAHPNPETGRGRFLATILTWAKIHVVAVHPDHRGRGHGARLLRQAKAIATTDGLKAIYGQFAADRPWLADFYTAGGFTVLDAGSPLPIGTATDRPGDKLGTLPTERLFVWEGKGPRRPDRDRRNGQRPPT
ncbi:GNAT family N-acetyltransferase [Mycolicibacterium mageritense]|uniref:GNAT family N-acetyltransferase n=1 Tax=Mycolicibacterium mageritense TaxID=53462 RepID=UPI0011DAF307|nr:GNAT family N-acetyltransferase [Mycolicibacterium mageritense]TXI56461.1 MAG: N-acetyltransferase [Mycolicibacterium mageritense]